jgi:hypothetical protein
MDQVKNRQEISNIYTEDAQIQIIGAFNFVVQNLGNGTVYLNDNIPIMAGGTDGDERYFECKSGSYGKNMSLKFDAASSKQVLVIANMPLDESVNLF